MNERKWGGKESVSFHHYKKGEKLLGQKKIWPQTSFNHDTEMGLVLYQHEEEEKKEIKKEKCWKVTIAFRNCHSKRAN